MKILTSITGVKHTPHNKLYRLQKIFATRWWSKDKALSSIMDIEYNESDDKIESSKFVTLLQFLTTIIHRNFNSQTKYMAKTLISN